MRNTPSILSFLVMGPLMMRNLGITAHNRRPKNRLISVAALVALPLAVAGCTSTEKALPTSASQTTEQVDQGPVTTGAPKVEKITGGGGTKIAVIVNNQPITSNDITRRAAFVKLRRMKGNRRSVARQELIDEAIKNQEARRLGVTATQEQVDQSYAQFAKNNKMTQSTLRRILTQSGVGVRGFKDFIRSQISWQRALSIRVQRQASSGSSNRGLSPSWLPNAGTGAGTENEYTLQQVVFTVPAAKRASLLSARRTAARNFRNRMQGCENAKEMAKSLKDVAVIDRGRVLDSQLPSAWRKDILATKAGGVTRVRDTPRGVEMLAVCRTREVIGSAQAANAKLFQGGDFRKAASKVEKEYFDELKKRAVISSR